MDLEIKDNSTTEFTIKNSVHAMSVLSKSLYSDPILAIVRELSCNALDSHIEAGTQDTYKFNVYLDYEHFSIRDFGTGLAPNDLERIYTTYFESTKTNNNDYIGSFGLGSKSPFAYTDKFTVRTYYYGTLTTYEAKKDYASVSIEKRSAEFTDQPNGLEVYFRINYGDLNKFHVALEKVLPFFGDKYDSLNYKIKFNNCFLLKDNPYPSDCNYILQKNVVYRLDDSKLSDSIGVELLNKKGLFFVAPPGSLSVAPSREELHYDSNTIATLESIITAALDEVKAYIKQEIEGKTIFELRSQYITELQSKLGNLLCSFDKAENFNGELVNYKINSNPNYSYSIEYPVLEKHSYKGRIYEPSYRQSISYSKLLDSLIIYNDLMDAKVGLKRAKNKFLSSGETRCIYLENSEYYYEFCKELALPPSFINKNIIKTSDIKIKGSSTKSVKDNTGIVFITYGQANIPYEVKDVSDANHYFLINYNNPVIFGNTLDKDSRSDFVKFLQDLDIKAYGVNKKHAEELDDSWICVDDILLDKYHSLYAELQNKKIYHGYNRIDIFEFLKYIPGEVVIKGIIDNHDSSTNIEIQNKRALFNSFGNYIPKEKLLKLADLYVNYEALLYKAYPMLQFIDNYKVYSCKEVIIQYVERLVNDQVSQSGQELSKQSSTNTAGPAI